MEKKTKIILGIAIGLTVGVGLYLTIPKLLKKKEEETPAVEEKNTSTSTPTTEHKSTPAKSGSTITIKKPDPKGTGFNPAPAQKPATPVATSKGTTHGTWVYAKMDGVKTYKKSTTKGVTLGAQYNVYKKNEIIGTFVGSTSVSGEKYIYVNDYKTPLVVSDKLVYIKTIK